METSAHNLIKKDIEERFFFEKKLTDVARGVSSSPPSGGK